MPKPTDGSPVTQEQIKAAVNYTAFSQHNPVPDGSKAWHQGQLEGWAVNKFGYGADGIAFYGGALSGSTKIHLYYLPDRDGFILLQLNETPANYNVGVVKK